MKSISGLGVLLVGACPVWSVVAFGDGVVWLVVIIFERICAEDGVVGAFLKGERTGDEGVAADGEQETDHLGGADGHGARVGDHGRAGAWRKGAEVSSVG